MLNGVEHAWNSVNGGSVSISDLNISPNTFFGGNVERLGFIKEYGFYACQSLYANNKILGFYIHDPSIVTELGKKLVRAAFPSCDVVFDTYHESAMTEADYKELRSMKQDAEEHGLSPDLINHSNAVELKALISSVKSGHVAGKVAEVSNVSESPILTKDAEHLHIGGNLPSKTVLSGKMQPKGNRNGRR